MEKNPIKQYCDNLKPPEFEEDVKHQLVSYEINQNMSLFRKRAYYSGLG